MFKTTRKRIGGTPQKKETEGSDLKNVWFALSRPEPGKKKQGKNPKERFPFQGDGA